MKKYVFEDPDVIEKLLLLLASPEVLKDSIMYALIAVNSHYAKG